MPILTSTQASKLQSNPSLIRNLCILAHVDHGKTTLSDSLLASNGVISSRIAGKVRYLDSREDEQLRGITMESSAISLHFPVRALTKDGTTEDRDYLINLIDSPGHVDFSGEVSSASRICDGALVLVDSVEGVCTQTHTVLRQAWVEKIQPILVFNKVDRLITELQMSPSEAYVHITKILEQVNAIIASFFTDDIIGEDSRKLDAKKEQGEDVKEGEWILEERDDSDIYFAPERGNVIFCSAIDGWAFRIENFAKIYSKKLGMNEKALLKCLWGSYYFDPKTKSVLLPKHLKNNKALKPMFVQFILEQIWSVYDCVYMNPDADKVSKIITSLGVKVNPRDLKSKDTRGLLWTIMSQWLSLASTCLLTVVEKVPSPLQAQPKRMPKILYPNSDTNPEPSNEVEKMVYNCENNPDSEMVAYVSKTFYVSPENLPENRRVQLTAEEMRERRTRELLMRKKEEAQPEAQHLSLPPQDELQAMSLNTSEIVESPKNVLIGFARIFSGTIKLGQKIYILGPRYDPNKPDEHCSEITVERLYLLMGRDLYDLPEVPAGNVFGISGIDGHILKTGTLSTTKDCRNLGVLRHLMPPILRVALEPMFPRDLNKLEEGLKLLNQSDPSVEIILQETGEHVLVCAGEVHLERCLTDLRDRFAQIEIQVSDPIVPFRETVYPLEGTSGNWQQSETGQVTIESSTGEFSMVFRLVPLPSQVHEILLKSANTIKQLQTSKSNQLTNAQSPEEDQNMEELSPEDLLTLGHQQQSITADDFANQLENAFKESKQEGWEGIVDQIWSFGPKGIGSNILVNKLGYSKRCWFELAGRTKSASQTQDSLDWGFGSNLPQREIEEGIRTGFQVITQQGPLCAEPVAGTCFIVEKIVLGEKPISGTETPTQKGKVLSGQQAFLSLSPRMLLATYSCDIQATAEVLGKVYAVLARRRGRVLSEEMKEGTTFFQISAKLPVIESFEFSEEIRKKTSGAAIPQLIFSGFEVYDQNPFWVPTTEEELEDLGEKADRANVAKKYMDMVRRRKGLFVDERVVISAEKQRTLKK
ncbi:P-loop containing nucleoside triphosphate hydrolase protein [Conidiobolus coronatus NRRL 28638]|uniref:Ribosome assembly protein 1 n=1 Tax=Conidiobolus coronatus (strain ATCC 28846 / CBS 209.66 / NRRL 28638) TaxID=796925 RepID=A0A137P4R2_CONC2|nr:P-loop containing nucleoside triphosphate hydrolase protein [Conidiobolus coronatus NRRL 28638]|eukprot:KXN70007.1 P-loop containing nucleoside triphosphate hydrolase protein [Conidiobolus coronatus NRRL 28638]